MNKHTTIIDGDNDRIFIIPTETKPIKIIFEELSCPILSQLKIVHKCKHAKSSWEDLIYNITCNNIKNCKIILDNKDWQEWTRK